MSWRWIDARALLLLHDESIAEHGGAPGIRDTRLLEAAMSRPLNLAGYGQPDPADLAAAYGVGLAKNHAFVDGNNRVAFLAFLAIGLFLVLNGHRLVATQAEATLVMLDVAGSHLDETALAAWLSGHISERR
ncbi:MAG: type II toxin-antitoxin system death-on-curing family toxin [Rubrivivax sp.]|nr:type II toxin-antitoxin system death-on-curing family toxin [Rubrivivax sp.]